MTHRWTKQNSAVVCSGCGAYGNYDNMRGSVGFAYAINPINHDVVFVGCECDSNAAIIVQLTKAKRFIDDDVIKPNV
jgi:hypothetical protein